ncbi:MAG: BatA domain-containing protein [Candidatus Hydrogenedentota bacterium]
MIDFISFKEPFYLNFIFLSLIPILIHLLKIKPREKEILPTLRFLLQIKDEPVQKTKIRDIISLLLKVLCILFFILGFAMPVYIPFSRQEREALFIIDDSVSMKAGEEHTSFDKSIEVIRRVYKRLQPRPVLYLPFSKKRIIIKDDYDFTGFQATYIGDNRELILALYKEFERETQRAVLFTDFVGRGWNDITYAPDNFLVVKTGTEINNSSSIDNLYFKKPYLVEESRTELNAIIKNKDSIDRILRLKIEPETVINQNIKTDACYSFIIKVPQNRFVNIICSLTDDDFKYDNVYYFTERVNKRPNILILQNPKSAARISGFYIKDALKPYLEEKDNIVNLISTLSANDMTDNNDIFFILELDDDIDISKEKIIEFLSKGKRVFITLSRNFDTSQFCEFFFSQKATFKEEKTELATFSENIRDDIIDSLKSTIVYKYFRLEGIPPDYETIISLSNNEPFIVHRKIGKGDLYIVLSSLMPEYNELMLSRGFLPFLNNIIFKEEETKFNYNTGDFINFKDAERVIFPTGKIEEIKGENYFMFQEPGIHKFIRNKSEIEYYSVNIPKEEGSFDIKEDKKLGKIILDKDYDKVADSIYAHLVGKDLWRYMFLLSLLFLISELLWYRKTIRLSHIIYFFTASQL